MAKQKPPPPPLPWHEPQWSALGRRLAAFAGASTGLVALWYGVSSGTAALRGLLALVSVLGLFRLGGRALASRWAAPSADAEKADAPASPAEARPAR